jgi:hypothetical protein
VPTIIVNSEISSRTRVPTTKETVAASRKPIFSANRALIEGCSATATPPTAIRIIRTKFDIT